MLATIGPLAYPIQVANYQPSDRLGSRSTVSFEVEEDDAVFFQFGEQVTLTDPTLGTAFTGFVERDAMSYLPGTQTRSHLITCKGEEYLADKRSFTQPDNGQRVAGDYALDLVHDYLAAEGVTAKAAYRHDKNAAMLAQGTLAHTAVENGVLVLARDGSTFSVTETSPDDFAAGTLTNVQANSDGTLTLASFQALKLTGTCTARPPANSYAGRTIWSGSHVVASGDILRYGVWCSSTSPDDVTECNLSFSDGSRLDTLGGFYDQFSILATNASMGGNATDTWYERRIDISAAAGKTLVGVSLSLCGDDPGAYIYYFRDIRLTDVGGGTVRVAFFASALQKNVQLGGAGYTAVDLAQVTAYQKSGTRLSPAYANTRANTVGASLVTWTATLAPALYDSDATHQPLTVQVSLNGGASSYPPGVSGQPVPTLLAGTDLSGSAARFSQTLTNYGTTPEQSPVLDDVALVITPGYYQVHTDVGESDATQSDFGTGTLTNVTNQPDGLALSGFFRSWDDGDTSSQTTYGTGSPTVTASAGDCILTCDAGAEVRSRLDFAGQWQDFIAEADVELTSSVGWGGLVYRTTYWGDTNDTYAYVAYMDDTTVKLGRGTNTSSGGFTTIQSVSHSFAVGGTYRFRLEVSGSSHTVYVDDVLFISATDATFTAAGYLGLRFRVQSGVRASGTFAAFGVVAATTGSRVHPALDLTPAGVVGSSSVLWTASVPDVTALLIEASLDGGATWAACANGGALPGLLPGTPVSGVSLLLRDTLSTHNPSQTPLLSAISASVVGRATLAEGTRIAPPLDVTPVGPIDSCSVSWAAVTPPSTAFHVDTSLDGGATWTNVAASGDPVPGLLTGGPAYTADMHSDDSGTWAATHESGGADATWEWDTDNFLLAARDGTNAVSVLTPNTAVDSAGNLILSRSDDGGILLRATTTYAGTVLADRPIRYYRLDEASGTVARDLGSQGRDGTLHGAVTLGQPGLIAGESDTALLLDGATADISLPTTGLPSGAAPWSAELWWEVPAGGVSSWQELWHLGTFGGAASAGVRLAYDGASWRVDDAGFSYSVHGGTVVANGLYYAVVTYDGASIALFVNTVLIGSAALALNLAYGVAQIGADEFGNYASGTVDEAALYDYALTAAQIAAHAARDGNHYRVVLHDDLSASSPQTLTVSKRVAGVRTQLDQQPIPFVRGEYHHLSWTIQGTSITCAWDGAAVSTMSDSAVATCTHSLALFNGSGTAWYHVLRSQQQGQSLSGSVTTRVRMSTADAGASPQLADLTLAVRSADIQPGAFIGDTTYQYQNTVAGVADDLAKRSDFWWAIQARAFTFRPRPMVYAPWPLASIDLDLQASPPPLLTSYAPLYRNRQFITGAFDTVAVAGEEKRGDGSAQSWTLRYPVFSAPAIALNGVAQTVGVAGIDTGRAYYWTYQSPTISQDQSAAKLTTTEVLSVDYTGLVDYVAQADNVTQQIALATLEGGSGIVEAVEKCNGLLKAAADQLAQARIMQYAILSTEFEAVTLRAGLASGQTVFTFIPEYGLNNQAFQITEVSEAIPGLLADGTPFAYFTVKMVSGPNASVWQKFFTAGGAV